MKQLLMTTILIFGLTAFTFAQTVPSYVPTNGLEGWWPFNGNANDESANGNNGNLAGPLQTDDRFSIANSAIIINQIDDIMCTTTMINNPQVFSISLWFKTSLNGWIFGFDDSQCSHILSWDRYLSINSNGNLDFRIFTVSSQNINITTNGIYNDDNWHHCVYGLSNSTMTIYIDGQLVANSPSNVIAEDYQGYWRVGGLGGTVPSMLGQVDDIGIWNRALTQEEISSLNSGSPLGINEALQSNLFSVFPNPAKSVININLDPKLVGSFFTIYDNIGKAVKTGKLNSVNTIIELNDLSIGIYTFSVGENKKQTFKVIKE